MKRGKQRLEEQQDKGLGMHQKEPLCQLGRQESIPIESCDKIGQQEVPARDFVDDKDYKSYENLITHS